jgi:hypothetical protein
MIASRIASPHLEGIVWLVRGDEFHRRMRWALAADRRGEGV